MRVLYVLFFLLISCSQILSSNSKHDVFDKIIEVMKEKSIEGLSEAFGKPDEIVEPSKDFEFKIFRYNSTRIDAYIDIKRNKISHLTLFYFEDIDNYIALKKRFKDYQWIESKLSDDSKTDVVTDLYLVKIPEIGMEFQYDNYVPKRKVMWLYFN